MHSGVALDGDAHGLTGAHARGLALGNREAEPQRVEAYEDVLFERQPFLNTLRQGRTVYAVLTANDYAALRDEIGVATCVLERQSTVNVKLKAVIAREPLPEVLLITNRCQ